MRIVTRLLVTIALLIVPSSFLFAQAAANPSGHWEGSIQVQPNMAIKVEVDLAKNSKGELAGTFGQPDQGVKGLPLSTVAVESRSIRFVVKAGPQPATFTGTLAADGKSISGAAEHGGQSIPFTLARTGDAKIAEVPRNAAIGKELEGSWHGALEVTGGQMRVIVKMANQADGTAAGTIISPDGSNVELPIGIVQKTNNVSIEVPSVGASFVGVLTGTELAGTWTQGPSSLPLTLKLAKP
jgi:hypothetical protein